MNGYSPLLPVFSYFPWWTLMGKHCVCCNSCPLKDIFIIFDSYVIHFYEVMTMRRMWDPLLHLYIEFICVYNYLSVRLTAYIAKVFCQAKHVVDDSVDEGLHIVPTINWLTSHQNDDGSFTEHNRVTHSSLMVRLPTQWTETFGSRPHKTCLRGSPTTNAQTSLHIHAVWSEPLLFAFWKE